MKLKLIKSINFIDEITIEVNSGNGGNGCISFYKLKNSSKKIPNGGNGGNGGNVYLIADKHINTLEQFNFKNKFKAQNGFKGMKNNSTGKNGKDMFIKIPLQTSIFNKTNGKFLYHTNYDNQKILIVKGGNYGLGNKNFHYSKNRIKFFNNKGKLGESIILFLEMKLIADVGLIGLPNSGKSTFVNSISSSKTKIANYPFTTLIPHLGAVKIKNKKFIVADMPGLIKGSSKGIGLGLKFLKHLEKCNILLHIIDISSNNILNIINEIKIIVDEINSFNIILMKKIRWIVFNKIDLLNKKELIYISKYIINRIKWTNKYYLISSIKKIGTYQLCKDIINFIYK